MRIADLTADMPALGSDLTRVRNLSSASAMSALENAAASGASSKLEDVVGSMT
jgi:hypothetical protein